MADAKHAIARATPLVEEALKTLSELTTHTETLFALHDANPIARVMGTGALDAA